MAAKRGRYNVRLIRRDLSYTVEEVTACLGVHTNTVREWIRGGLPTIDSKRPLLIHGASLIAFLRDRQTTHQVSLALHEFYCVKCRCARTSLDGTVNIRPRDRLTLNLSAICGTCETSIHKIGSIKKLDKYHQIFDSATLGKQHIFDTQIPSVNCDFKEHHQND